MGKEPRGAGSIFDVQSTSQKTRSRTNKSGATSASKPVTEPIQYARLSREMAKNKTMVMSALRPKEKNGKASNNAFISVPVTKKSAPFYESNNNLSFASLEGLVIAIACLLGSPLSATLLALVPTLRAAATALNEVALLAEAQREIPDTLAAVRVSGLELTDALEEVGELTSEVTGVTKRTTKAIDRSLTTAQRVGGMVYEGSKTMVPNAKKQMKRTVKPIVRRTADEIEDIAKERAKMEPYAGEVLSGVASTTKKGGWKSEEGD